MSFEKQDLLTFQNQLNGNFIVSPSTQYPSLNDYLVAQVSRIQALEQQVQVALPLNLTFLDTTKATLTQVNALRTETLDLVQPLAPLVNPSFQGTVTGVTAAAVGLGNVNNTSDADLPISNATQAALDTKVDITTYDSGMITKASVTSVQTLEALVNTKVTPSELQDGLDTKVDISDYNDLVSIVDLKANTSDVLTSLNDLDITKADLSYVDTQLGFKLNTSDVANLLLLEADLEYVNTQLAIKVSTVDMNTLLDLKANITYVDEQLGLKLNTTEVENLLLLEADLSYVNTELATKANSNDVLSALAQKSDLTYVDTELSLKADLTYVDTELGTKANTIDMSSALDLKADVTYVDTGLGTKANTIDMSSALDLKANVTYVDTGLGTKADLLDYNELVSEVALKANASDVSSALALKSDLTYVDTQLALKADITYVDTELGTKANSSDVTTTLSEKVNIEDYNDLVTIVDLKANSSDVSTSLALKADVTYVDNGLGTKANILDMSSALDLKADTSYVGTQLALKANSSTVNTSLALKASTSYVDTEVALLVDEINNKQDILSSTNRLASSNVSTYINDSNGVLSTVLQSLTDINTSQSTSISTLEGDLVTERNRIDGHHTRLGVVETAIDDLLQADISHSNRMDGIDDLVNTKQSILSSSNKLSASLVSTTTSTVDLVLDDLVTAVQTLDTEKQDVINSTTNKLPYDHIDFTGSYWSSLDFPTSIQSKFTSLDNAISTLEGLQEGDVTSFQTINTALTTLDTEKQDVLSSSNKLDGAYVKYNNSLTIIEKIDTLSGGGGIASISYDGVNLETTISDRTIIGTDLEFPDTTIQTTAFTSSKNTDLANVKTKVTDLSYVTGVTTIANELSCNNITGTTISDIQTSLSGKQSTLNGTTNQLPYTYVNFTGSNIPYADYGSSITTKFSAIDTTLSGQGTTNLGFANDISGLTSSKQDVLSADNKLNSAFLACSGSGVMSNTKMEYLSSISSDIQTQIASKQNTITDGSLTIARTDGLQSALNLKANKAGETYTGTHDFSAATVTGVGVTIADGALSIAKTANLQTTLDSKAPLLRQFENYGTLSSQITMTTAQFYKVHIMSNSSTSQSVKLPSNASCNNGDWIGFNWFSTGGGGVSLTIYENNGSSIVASTGGTANSGGNIRYCGFFGGKWYSI